MNKIILAIFTGLIALSSFAQVTSAVDSTEIKIGSAFQLTIKADASKNSEVNFPNEPVLGPFEVLDQSAIDTVILEDRMELIKKYTLTQFDSGTYTLPRLSVYIDGKNHQTDFFEVKVNDVEVDTMEQPLYDIKTQIEAPADSEKMWKYIVAILFCVLAGIATYFIIKRAQNKNLSEEDLYKTPLEKATKKLQLLDAKRLVYSGEVKTYYSEMTDVIREYIEEVFEIPAKESTTSELLQHLLHSIKVKKIKLSKETINDLKRVLQTADLVKFAKSEPQIREIEQDRKASEAISVSIDQAIPRFFEEQSERVKLRERRFKKRKQQRVWFPIAVSVLLLMTTGIVYLVQVLQSDSEWTFMESNKRLYNGEWVTSDYGFPTVIISTPEALLRADLPQSDSEKMQSQSSIFSYTNLKTQLAISVSTTARQVKDSVDLQQLLDSKLERTASVYGAQNIVSNAEQFQQQGVNGIRGSGSLSAQNFISGKTVNLRYDMYLFAQKNGIQEIAVMYKEGDTYGEKINQRIMESIQLNVVKSNE